MTAAVNTFQGTCRNCEQIVEYQDWEIVAHGHFLTVLKKGTPDLAHSLPNIQEKEPS